MTFPLRLLVLGLLAGLALAAPARADLVVLSSGRVISASSVVLTADTATIRLRGGGEVTCDRALVVRVDPDETPWIDPAGAAAAAGDAASPANAGAGWRRRCAPSRFRPPTAPSSPGWPRRTASTRGWCTR